MAEILKELDIVALIKDLPEENLTAGQTGTVVFVHKQGEAFEVQFIMDPRRSMVATVQRDCLLKLKGLEPSKVLG